MRPSSPRDPSRTQVPDDGIDVIPMNKPSAATYVALAVGILVVAGFVIWGVAGRSGSAQGARVGSPSAGASAGEVPAVDPTLQREHLAMTQRALAAAEEKKRERESAEAAERAVAEATATTAAPAGGPAPVAGPRPIAAPGPAAQAADDLDSLGDDIASKLQ